MVTASIILVLILWIMVVIGYFVYNVIMEYQFRGRSLIDHIAELDQIIETEFIFCCKLPHMSLEFKMIEDFKKTQDYVVKRVIEYLGDESFIKFKCHGMSKTFVIRYVTRRVQLLAYDEAYRRRIELNGK